MAVRPAPSATPRIPLTVGNYTLSGQVATGTNGLIYRARDAADGLVLVQLIPAPSGKSGILDALTAEYHEAAKLEHPNIVRVLDFGQEGEFAYFVSEWTEGQTLARMIESHSRLPEEAAIRIITQIGQAVDYAHSVTRGPWRVCPWNVLVRGDGVAKLAVFDPAGTDETPPPPPPPPPPAAETKKLSFFAPPPDPKKTPVPPADPKKAAAPASPPKPTNPFALTIHSLGTTLYAAVAGRLWVDPATVQPSVDRRGRPRSPRRKLVTGLTERVDMAVRRATDPEVDRRPTSCAEWLKLLRSRPRTAATPRPDVRPDVTDADDRRSFVRYALGVGSSCTINTSVFDSAPPVDSLDAAVWPLVVRDVSAGGIGILLARRCEPGTELAVELIGGVGRTRSLMAKVVRVKRDTHGHWVHGCEFLAPLDQKELAAVLGHLGRTEVW